MGYFLNSWYIKPQHVICSHTCFLHGPAGHRDLNMLSDRTLWYVDVFMVNTGWCCLQRYPAGPWPWDGADFQDVSPVLGLTWAGCLCWYSRLLLQFSVSGNDIEARVGGDYPVTKCVCREIWSTCIKCFWLSAKVSVQRLGEGSSLPFLSYWRWEWMSLLDSMVITLKTSIFFF